MEEKVLIYPYSREYESMVIHQNLAKNYQIVSAVSPPGWGYDGDIIETKKIKIIVSSNIPDELEKCTTVWIVKDGIVHVDEKIVEEMIKLSRKKGKKVVITRYTNLKYQNDTNIIDKAESYKEAYCLEIKKPVIAVLGGEEYTDKYEIQLVMYETLKQIGYKVSLVSSRQDSWLMDIHPFPEFMFSKEYNETEKIVKYNHYVKAIEVEESPDIILLGIPGGTLQFDDINHNNFAIPTYEVSKAVNIDFGILCLPYQNDLEERIPTYGNEIFSRFKIPVQLYHIASITEDMIELENDVRSFLFLKDQFIDQKVADMKKIGVFNLKNLKSSMFAANYIINFFSNDVVKNV